MKSSIMEIDNCAFTVRSRSNAQNELDRHEEDIWNARESLRYLVLDMPPTALEEAHGFGTPADWFMFLLKPVADYFEVDSDTVLDSYINHYAPGGLMYTTCQIVRNM